LLPEETLNKHPILFLSVVSVTVVCLGACGGEAAPSPTEGLATRTRAPATATPTPTIPARPIDRETSLATQAVDVAPDSDDHPSEAYSEDYEQPVPLPGLVNTTGSEGSPFITPNGETLYFFFTPDAAIPIDRQIRDGVTGIYVSKKVDGSWAEPQGIVLQDPGKLALDGCPFVQGDVMWFCSARVGYTGVHWFTADYVSGAWRNWRNADFSPDYEVGELEFSQDRTELYFASSRPGGRGGLDIWLSRWIDGGWGEPVNVAPVNSVDGEGWPALNPSGDELWFSRNYGIWRSRRVEGEWKEPELILSPLAGEPTIDSAGNVYFVHHFLVGDRLSDADIYIAYKKKG
jgi:hypothetical protein